MALAAQMPGGALVDAVRSTRLVGIVAVVLVCASALALALWPLFAIVLVSRAMHAAASCVLGPVIAALSLGLAGHANLGERLGRNARYASIGCGVAAAAMGACGYLLTSQSVFFLTAALVAPAVWALSRVRTDAVVSSRGERAQQVPDAPVGLGGLLRDRRLLVFAGCVLLFQLANAAMLPLMGSILALRLNAWATVLIGACIVVPQLVVAISAPWVGRKAHDWGRRPLLFACFAALAIRGVFFALVTDPYIVVAVQVLDGISAAVLGVMLPLVVADITRGTGRFNLALGIVGSAVGVGAALSTTLAGVMMDHAGAATTFLGLAGLAVCGLAMLLLLPETHPDRVEEPQRSQPLTA